MERRGNTQPGSIFKIFYPIVIILIVQNALEIFLMQIYLVRDLANYKTGSFTDLIDSWLNKVLYGNLNQVLSVCYAVICIGIFAYYYIKEYTTIDRAKAPFRGLSDNTPIMLVGIIVFSLGLQYLSVYLLNSIAAVFPAWLSEYENLLKAAGFSQDLTPIVVIYAIVLGPICEELAFRGITFKAARRVMPLWPAIIAQAAIFGIFHGNKLQGCYTFVVGIAFGYIMYRYDNIVITIIIHMIYNLIGVVGSKFMFFGGSNVVTYFLCFLGSLIASYVGILLLQKAAPGVKVEE